MAGFDITTLQDASILTLNDMRDSILIDPDYQREGGIWTRSKKQLFIDSLINRYDVPKFYFHRLTGEYKNSNYDYSIIDGRQRLETIWQFLNNEFPLSKDFELLEDPTIVLSNLYFKDFPSVSPRIATRLYGRTLSVMLVITDDIDFIEDMFTRLNEAVPLNASEKRNSFGGPLPLITRNLVEHPFFTEEVLLTARRYRHHDLVAKMLYLEYTSHYFDLITDTKKATLDYFFRQFKEKPDTELKPIVESVRTVLDDMAVIFGEKDDLLKSGGVIPVYFLLFAKLRRDDIKTQIVRPQLMTFEEARAENRRKFQQEENDIDFRLLEYDDLAQSSNDGSALTTRLDILMEYLGIRQTVNEKT